MYSYQRQVFLRETDATGAIFFSEQLNFAIEALEAFFLSRGFAVQKMMSEGHFAMPIVRVESDFFAPLRLGDRFSIELALEKKSERSFTLKGELKNAKGGLIGQTLITHVCVSQVSGQSIPLPAALLCHLNEL